jgi:hypothetical protein
MDEQLEFLQLVVARLEAAGIPYMLTGSLALAIHALPRMTRDVDLVIDADERRVATLVQAFAADSYVSAEAASAAVRDHGMFNAIHLKSLLKADFIVLAPEAYELAKFGRRLTVDLGGFSASVITPEDLVLSKLLWARTSGSARQEEDVRAVLERPPELDWTYLSTWAVRLDLADTIDRLRPS